MKRVSQGAAVAAGVGFAALVGGLAGALVVASAARPALPKAFAVTSLADDTFAVCTAPVDSSNEGFFILDFETGDLSGGVLHPNARKFTAAYKGNVLKDLGFKPGDAKNPRFLLVAGTADLRGGRVPLAASVLYVTDSATGVTVAYGIPWSPQQSATGAPFVGEFVLLDKANPRGGGATP
jgi:hypothetical protein